MKLTHSQKGLSIIELMVAMVLSLLLLVGVLQIFLSNQQSFRLAEASSRVQESGRMAVDMLTRLVRNADYWGCAGAWADGNVTSNLDPSGTGYAAWSHAYGNGLAGADDNALATDTILDGTDSITIRGARGGDIRVTTDLNQPSAVLKVTSNAGLLDGQIVLLSDCVAGDVFQITSYTAANGNTVHNSGNSTQPGNFNPTNPGCPGANAHCLSRSYEKGASIFVPYVESYFISSEALLGTGTSTEPNLYVTSANTTTSVTSSTTVPLVEGVENMQILYGEDTDQNGTVNRWVSAATVTNMDDVLGVRVSLLVRSPNNNVVTGGAQTYSFMGANVTATDQRLRRVYTATASIRNRI